MIRICFLRLCVSWFSPRLQWRTVVKLVRRKAVVAAKRMAVPANSKTFPVPGYLPTSDYVSLILTVNVLVYKDPSIRGVIELLFPCLVGTQIWVIWASLRVSALPSWRSSLTDISIQRQRFKTTITRFWGFKLTQGNHSTFKDQETNKMSSCITL